MKTIGDMIDRVESHLIKQGRRSYMATVGCAYRGPDNRACAVGCLIPDHVYARVIEGKRVTTPPVLAVLAKVGITSPIAISVLEGLQDIHDGRPVSRWSSCIADMRQQHCRVLNEGLSDAR